ncbi:MAG TPA: type II toxin-antitoxin system PemK/MazF family toxin [Terriglobia bacterium]|nr:type II toxin-antitoxin system PemK/MazF family toxin [Terriglobia bacterium]
MSLVSNPQPIQPRRGEIWFVRMPSDPPDKNARPVIIVSLDARNRHPRATTVLVVPLSTTLRGLDTHVRLEPGETGLAEASEAQAENITTVRKESLAPSRSRLRAVSATRLGQIARCVVLAMGVLPGGLPGNSA